MSILSAGKRTLLVVSLAGFVLALGLGLSFGLTKSPAQQDKLVPPTADRLQDQEEVEYGSPVRLKIPSIGVNTNLEHVGLTSEGEVGVPKGPARAGWFDNWPRPGQNGSAIIVGHYGWVDGKPAVFDKLHALQKGDKLYVEDDKGEIITFVVRYSQRYDPEEHAPDVFKPNDGLAHLNLITCEGAWNETQDSYSTRLVVFTDKL